MVNRDKLIDFINKTLNYEPDKDPYLINSLQVIGKENVKKVALGVSANLDFFQKAAKWGADLIVLHHGLLGAKAILPITKVLKNRLKILFDRNMTLLTYHYFLDSHHTLGNNAQIIKLLGAQKGSQFGKMNNLYWGWEGNFLSPIAIDELVKRLENLIGAQVKIFKYGPKKVEKIGVISGGGSFILSQAIDRNLDAFLTGEARESTENLAKEAGIHFIYLGHYNSEKFGILALKEVIKKQFPQLEVKFINVPNPL